MDNAVEEGAFSIANCQSNQASQTWKHEVEWHDSQVEKLEEKLMNSKANIGNSEDDSNKELELLSRRAQTTATMLTYLKCKARIMAVPHLAHTSCGIKHQEGVGLVDKHGIPLSDWSKDVNLSSLGCPDEETQLGNSLKLGTFGAGDGEYVGDIIKSVCVVTDVMESLLKKVIIAENEVDNEKEKVKLGHEENKRKTLQIESMSAKVEEMEKFALDTNVILNEMRQKVEEMVEETSMQRHRAADNEEELHRVKHDFETLKSFVSNIITVRETLLSSEQQFETMEKVFERLVAKTNHLEKEKDQKEAEVQKLMEENVRLRATLDKKEAQLMAMSEQCKFMALDNAGI